MAHAFVPRGGFSRRRPSCWSLLLTALLVSSAPAGGRAQGRAPKVLCSGRAEAQLRAENARLRAQVEELKQQLASTDPDNAALAPQGDCVFVANLHVPKCGGTTLRHLLTDISDLPGSPWRLHYAQGDDRGWCADLMAHVRTVNQSLAEEGGGLAKGQRVWAEVHCSSDLIAFIHGVSQLRALLEPRGCRVVSTVLLREPVAQAVSEWRHFCVAAADTGGGECVAQPQWADDVLAWAAAHRERLMHLLTQAHYPLDFLIENGRNDPRARAENGRVADERLRAVDWLLAPNRTVDPLTTDVDPSGPACSAALELLGEQLRQVDVLGTVGGKDEFEQFWRRLSARVGGPGGGDAAMRARGGLGGARDNEWERGGAREQRAAQKHAGFAHRLRRSPAERRAERAALATMNACSGRLYEQALAIIAEQHES